MAEGDLTITVDIGAITDPMLKPVASYPAGTVGRALARLAGGPVSVVAPFDRRADMRLVVGDDYLAAQGRQIDVPAVDGDDWPASLTGWALSWRARPAGRGREVTADSVAATDPDAPGQAVRLELAAAVTGQLLPGTWSWRVLAVKDGVTVTLRHGRLLVS